MPRFWADDWNIFGVLNDRKPVADQYLVELEWFMVPLYGRTSIQTQVNDIQLHLFTENINS